MKKRTLILLISILGITPFFTVYTISQTEDATQETANFILQKYDSLLRPGGLKIISASTGKVIASVEKRFNQTLSLNKDMLYLHQNYHGESLPNTTIIKISEIKVLSYNDYYIWIYI